MLYLQTYLLDYRMKNYIRTFPNQLREAISIGQSVQLNPAKNKIQNVLICGIGGSGIGGTIASKLVSKNATIPVLINNEYTIPSFVNQNTLVIVSSYSGNTEETLSAVYQALEQKAEIACITSGGEVLEIAKNNNLNVIQIPGGNPPRACLGYSFVQQLFLLQHYQIISDSFVSEVLASIELLESENTNILKLAEDLAKNLVGKIPVIYSSDNYDAVAVRFCQQLNENSKNLCWHNKLPELNHNEIVGWTEKNNQLAVVFIKCEHDFYRTKKRMEITKDVVQQYAGGVYEIDAVGNSAIERCMYLINLTDWVSVILADLKNVDSIEINAINALKEKLSDLK